MLRDVSIIGLRRLAWVRTDMDLSPSACSTFLIDSLLSLRTPGALLSRADPPELSPASSSGCSGPPSPQRVPARRLESGLLHGQRRTVNSSFLIRDILADSRSYSDPGQPETFQSAPEEDYQDKSQSSSSDSESRGRAELSWSIDLIVLSTGKLILINRLYINALIYQINRQ